MDYLKTYSNFLRKFIKFERTLKIVCDSSNGTTGIVIKKVFSGIKNIELILINGKPDGNFPNHSPNPIAPGAMDQASKLVKKRKADIGAVFDADGDRVFFIDNKGKPIPSFIITLILSRKAKPPYVADELVYQSLLASNAFPKKSLVPSRVGFIFIKQKMTGYKASVGAEYSGHFYFKETFCSESGVLALIKVCNFLTSNGVPISDFIDKLPKQTVLLKNVKLSNSNDYWQKKLISYPNFKRSKITKRDGLTFTFPKGFLNIRPSNTEPLLRLTCGSSRKSECQRIIADLNKRLGNSKK
jgi:phosphomannomutase